MNGMEEDEDDDDEWMRKRKYGREAESWSEATKRLMMMMTMKN